MKPGRHLGFGDVLEFKRDAGEPRLVIMVIADDRQIMGPGRYRCIRLTGWPPGEPVTRTGSYDLLTIWGGLKPDWHLYESRSEI